MSPYLQWMGPPSCDKDVSGDHDTCQYQRVYLPANQVQAIMRLRVCNWRLEVYQNTARPRSERVCRKCSAGMPEDEYHVVFDCAACSDLRSSSGEWALL